jgi:hypothetical protein
LAPSKGSFKRLKGEELMGNIPARSAVAGGTEDVAGITQVIGWEMVNSTDEDMEVNINAVPVQGTPLVVCW